MRAMAAVAMAALGGFLVLHATDEPRSAQGPSGRASARRARPRTDRADGGGQDAGVPAGARNGSGEGDLGAPAGAPTRSARERAPRLLGDPPGTVRVSLPLAPADAGTPPDRSAVAKLEQQMGELRGRTAALEAQLARSQAQAAQLQRLNDQIAELRAQIAADSQRRAQADQAQALQRQQVQQAVSGLLAAQQVLAGGSADVADALSQAEATLDGDARRDLTAARQALQNRDLSAARYYLGAAIGHAQQQTR